MGRTPGVRLLLVGFALLLGLGVAVATGAVRVGKVAPPPSGPVIPPLGVAKNGAFTGSGVTFRYPAGWRTLTGAPVPVGELGPMRRIVIGSGAGSDRVVVQAFRLQTPISDATSSALMGVVSQEIAAFAQAEHGTVTSPVKAAALGEMPAFAARASWQGPGGVTMQGRFYFGYEGYAVFEVSCQRATTDPAEIDAGCDQIVKTFKVA